MKTIPIPSLDSAVILKPAELNRIHFASHSSPILPSQIKDMAADDTATPADKSKGASEP